LAVAEIYKELRRNKSRHDSGHGSPDETTPEG